MGNRVGTSFNTIQRLEKGESGISFRVMANIAKEFGWSLDYLIFGGDPDFGKTELLKSITYKIEDKKDFTEEEDHYIDKLFFGRMGQTKDKRLLIELSEYLSKMDDKQLSYMLKLLTQMGKLEKKEFDALLKLFS